MKKIADDEWFRLFGSRDQSDDVSNSDRELFLRTINETKTVQPDEHNSPAKERSVGPQRRHLSRKQMFTVDAELDLHLQTRETSNGLLETFLEDSMLKGLHTVRIITGKGHHSDRRGVLRSHVEQWIRSMDATIISWYAVAPRGMGGEGAWILRLVPRSNNVDVTENRD